MKTPPPKKQAKVRTGRRAFNGDVLDVVSQAAALGISEKTLRAQVARRAIPFRKWGGRIVFVRDEVQAFLRQLPGCDVAEAVATLHARDGASR